VFGSPKKSVAAALLLAVLTLGACGDDGGSNSGPSGSGSEPSGSGSGSHDHGEPTLSTIPPSEATVTVDVALEDFKIEGVPATIQGTKILFKVKNDGAAPHEFVILKGTETLIETAELARGETAEVAVELQPGRYTAKCLVGSGGGRHDKLGMVTNFTVA
jgi:hypothetical protein